MEKKYIKVEPIGESRTIFRDESEIVEDTYESIVESIKRSKEYMIKYKRYEGTEFIEILERGIAMNEAKLIKIGG